MRTGRAGSSTPRGEAPAYPVIVWKGTGHPSRMVFGRPEDALITGIDYLRRGYQVRLGDRTCDALSDGAGNGLVYARLVAALKEGTGRI